MFLRFKKIVVYTCVLMIGIQMTTSDQLTAQDLQQQEKVSIIAHRGNSIEAPENTLAAFRQAVELGADFIELDVHLSKEGIPVVVHDNNLYRTVDLEHPVATHQMTIEEIQSLDAGRWFDIYYAGEQIPLLQQVLELPLQEVGLMIEIKTGSADEETLAFAVLDALAHSSISSPVYLGSFSPKILEYIRYHNPEQPIIAIVDDVAMLSEHEQNTPDIYAFLHKVVNKELVQQCKTQGAFVWTWTVDEPDTMDRMIEKGVDGLISNDPKTAIRRTKEGSLILQ